MKNKMNTVYISGPMEGLPDFNYPAFNEEAASLRDKGYKVINPAENDEGDMTLPRHHYMRQDIKHLLNANIVVVLPGWSNSKGARLEVAIAKELRLNILHATSLYPVSSENLTALINI